MGMVCYFNPDTFEMESVLGESYNLYGDEEFEEFYQEVYDKVDKWNRCMRIDPPEAYISFKIMEGFIENRIPSSDGIKKYLLNALSGRKPFRHFKSVIDGSRYRQDWFDYKQVQLEEFVLGQLGDTAQ